MIPSDTSVVVVPWKYQSVRVMLSTSSTAAVAVLSFVVDPHLYSLDLALDHLALSRFTAAMAVSPRLPCPVLCTGYGCLVSFGYSYVLMLLGPGQW